MTIIETDCEITLELIETGVIDNHLEKIIIEECRMLKKKMEADIIHSLPEGNRYADMLSKMRINRGEQDIVVIIPRDEVVELIKQDMMGIAFSRGFNCGPFFFP